jgi:hypothetical protein
VPVSADQIEHGEAVLVADYGLTVDQAGLHRQLGHRSHDLREPAGEVVALAREQPHAAVSAPSHDPEAVVLDLVKPASPSRRLLRWAGKTGLDEGSQV